MHPNTNTLLVKARTQAILEQPFLAGLLLRLQLKEDMDCKAMGTDGEILAYNPTFVQQLPLSHLKSALVHEVLHCALCHHTRGKGRDHRLWNMACDYAINPLLKEQGCVLPAKSLIREDFKGMEAEAIYLRLQREQAQDQTPPNQAGKQTANQPQSSPSVQPPSGQPDASPANNEKPKPQIPPEQWGEVHAPAEAKQKQSEQEWRQAWTQTRMIARKHGDLPGGLDRAVQQSRQTTMSWREALAQFMTVSAKRDYSFQRPNRRFLYQGLYLPSMGVPALGPIVIAVDTSGSVTQELLDAFSAELIGLLQETQPESVTILICDYRIHEVMSFDPTEGASLKLSLKGGGGTSFVPVFEWVEQQSEPSLLLYLTDLEGRFPEHEPTYPVLWVTPMSDWIQTPPFGEVIKLPFW